MDDERRPRTHELLRKANPAQLAIRGGQAALTQAAACYQAVVLILFQPHKFFRLALIERSDTDYLHADKFISLISRKPSRIVTPLTFLAASIAFSAVMVGLISPKWEIDSQSSILRIWKQNTLEYARQNPLRAAVETFPYELSLHEQIAVEASKEAQQSIIVERLNKQFHVIESNLAKPGAVEKTRIQSLLDSVKFNMKAMGFLIFYSYAFSVTAGTGASRDNRWRPFWYWTYIFSITIMLTSVIRPALSYLIPPEDMFSLFAVTIGPALFGGPLVALFAWIIVPLLSAPSVFGVSRGRILWGVTAAGGLSLLLWVVFVFSISMFKGLQTLHLIQSR